MSFHFNNITKSYVRALMGVNRPAWAPVEHEIIEVPGRPGGYVSGKKTKVRVINVPIEIRGNNSTNLQSRKEELAAWLLTDGPKPLEFTDEPNRMYYAEVTGELDLDEILWRGKGVITFICPDPFKYSQEKTIPLNGSPILIEGTAPTYPTFTVTLKEPTAYLAIGDGDKVNMVGNPLSVEETAVQRLTRRLWSEADSLIGWTTAPSVEGGAVSGTMATDGYKFYASSYGTGTAWHGPAIKHSLPEVLNNFRVDAVVELDNISDSRGKIIVSGLDQAGNVVFRMNMGDAYATPRALGQVRAGNQGAGHNIISHIGDPPVWNNFRGMLRVARVGNRWEAYIARYDIKTGRYEAGMYETWIDGGSIYNRELSQIQVQVVSYGSWKPAVSRLEDIKVYRVNDLTPEQIPLIGEAGDVIEFDHVNDAIYRNGELITDRKAFLGDYFQLESGFNHLVVDPEEAIESAEVRWRDRWR